MKETKGITLVTLVITIIVSLLLAGVAIASMGIDDGLLAKSKESVNEYKQKTEEEQENIEGLGEMIKEYTRAPLGTAVFNENKTYDGLKKGTYDNPIIPKGFYPVNENQAIWGETEGYKKGLVIEDADRNQYVWVPVDGINVSFERVDWKYPEGDSRAGASIVSGTYSSYNDPTLPNGMSTSITINQGFYIARYEAGVSGDMKEALKTANDGTEVTALTSDTTAKYGTGTYKPVSKSDAMVWSYIKYKDASGYGANLVAKSLYPEDSENYGAISTLIYGVQWDTVLDFIGAYNVGEEGYDIYATNSIGMGNYSGTNEGDLFSEIAYSGGSDLFRQKNIYDMAGNAYEWTNEVCGARGVNRGGCYSLSGTPAATRYNRKTNASASYIGFRVALYVKITEES